MDSEAQGSKGRFAHGPLMQMDIRHPSSEALQRILRRLILATILGCGVFTTLWYDRPDLRCGGKARWCGVADLRCVGKARCCGVSVLRCGGCGSVAKLRMLRCGGGRFLLPPVPLLERAPLTAGSRPSWTLAPGCDGGGDFGARIFARPVFSGDCCANVACKR